MAKRGRPKILLWIGIIGFLIILLAVFSDLIVKYLWLDGLGYEQIFWTIKGTQFLLFFAALAVALIYAGTNVRFLTKNVKSIYLNLGQVPGGDPNITTFRPKQIKTILYVAGGLLSVFFAISYFVQWDEFFRFWHSQSFGAVDPIFGNDIGFYVLRLPFIETIQNSLIFLVFIVTAFLIAYHLASGALSFQRSQNGPGLYIAHRPRRQIFTNIALWLLLLAWGYYLERYQLLYESGDLIFGASYTDINIVIPVLWVMFIGCLLLAGLAFAQNWRNKIGWFIKGAGGLLAIGIIGQVLLPPAVQNFKVEPNELNLEKPYIKNNIKYTRMAYGLDDVTVKDYSATDTLTLAQIRQNSSTIENVRIWDQRLIVETYRQLQEIRLYYQFYNVDLDRYHTTEGYRQVLIAARELETVLPEQAQTWVNRRLQYTHGYGLVMSPSTEKTEQGSPVFYIQDIPPESSIGMNVEQPAIYYGESGSEYKVVNTQIAELHYPRGDENVYTHYEGQGGVSVNSFFEQLLFAWEFGDINLLLTDYIREGSKIQFWRTIQKRIREVAPFLVMKDDPYIVLIGGKLYWIQDAYTTASQYPYSESFEDYNYIRNSVKVVVDAYQGTVNFYIAEEDDPVLRVYREIFPEMFKPLNEMPATLKQHVKYPKHLFKVQLQKFRVYHMTDLQVFYNKEDLWERPVETYAGQQTVMNPYYLLTNLPDDEKLQYMLISPMTPQNRDNMIAWVTAKSDFPDYGEIVVFELPKERLYLGPAQIEAKINQDTDISRQLSLWDQRGSSVIRGNLMVIPIENSFLYVEPVFLISSGVNIPQLKRVIVTTGERVLMEPTLEEAIFTLYGMQQIQQPILDALPQQLTESVPSPQLQEVQTLWDELQTALQNSDWQTFGEKMEEINEILEQ